MITLVFQKSSIKIDHDLLQTIDAQGEIGPLPNVFTQENLAVPTFSLQMSLDIFQQLFNFLSID